MMLFYSPKTEQRMQTCLNRLQDYYTNWCLELNTEKTKTIISNKSGNVLKSNFFFKDKLIENVSSCKYLGVIFHASGSCSHARKYLYKRGFKATFCMFKLKSNVSDMAPGIKTMLHLFDHTVKPIVLYRSEMWGDVVLENNFEVNKIIKIYDQFVCQKLNIKYCKFILGVHKSSSNQAVLGEFGRFPLFIDIIINRFKYYKRINDMEQDSLLNQAINECT